jgi:hypothetical protein
VCCKRSHGKASSILILDTIVYEVLCGYRTIDSPLSVAGSRNRRVFMAWCLICSRDNSVHSSVLRLLVFLLIRV